MAPRAIVIALGVVGAMPLDVVAGLPLVLRAVLELQRAGLERMELVVADEATALVVRNDPRVHAEIVVTVAGDIPDVFRDENPELPALVFPCQFVGARNVYATLLAEAEAGRAVITANGPFVATEAWLAAVRRKDVAGAMDLLEPVDHGWIATAQTMDGRRLIIEQLFEACRKPVDGIVSRTLNRRISIAVSKRIVNTPISPNSITVVTGVLGVVAAVVVALGGYVWMLAGAILLQLNSILDGVDGELARVRFQHSKLGQWLDTICDDMSNTLFYAGTAIAAFQLDGLGPVMGWFGVVAVVGSLLTMTMYYRLLAKLGTGDFYALDVGQEDEDEGTSNFYNIGRYITKRDFFVLSFVVAASLGILIYILPIIAVGTMITTVTGVRLTMRGPTPQ